MLEAAALGATPEIAHIPIVASWASLFMVLFLIVLIAAVWKLTLVVLGLMKQSKDWTIPKQDEKLEQLRRDLEAANIRGEANRRDVDAAHAKADAVAREHGHYRREQDDAKEALLREIRSVGAQVALLLTMRDELRDVRDQSTKLEQDLASLVCFEDAQLRRSTLPGFCPIRKIECPINGESGAEPQDDTK
jgi:uncharacterized protein (DUF3084 family)